ncbi:MAG: sulfatase-like hydrolase/transferase, partial [Rikenellaceae bacterium]
MELKNQFSVLQSTTAIAAVALAGVGCSQQASETVDKGRPNVIVVLLDDLGSTDVGFSGCRDYHTPNIDRIANEGMSFSDAYISAPYSGPSRCGLMTGRYQQRFGAEGNIEGGTEAYDLQQGVLLSESLLSDVMKEQGYNTAAIGKWHLGDHPDLWPNQRGFDYFYGFAGGSYSFWGEKKDDKSGFIQEDGRPLENHETTYLTDDFTDKTLDFIDKSVKTDDPFFIYLAYNAPHTPLQAPQKYLDRTKHIYNAERSVYAAMMLAVDDGIGRIWESLEKHNIDDNTMIIFLSDNGGVAQRQALNTPRRAFKGNMFDGGIHTPFAIYWKGKIQAGSTYNKTISALDIFPTVATAAGFDVSKNKNPLDGVDLMPFITGKNNAAPH